MAAAGTRRRRGSLLPLVVIAGVKLNPYREGSEVGGCRPLTAYTESHSSPFYLQSTQHKSYFFLQKYSGVLTILTITSVSSIYVRTGSNITDCSMKCPQEDGATQLYKRCGDDEALLLELCHNMSCDNPFDPRLHVNTSSGCWTLTDAEKNDSCVYTVSYHPQSGRSVSITSLPITVLDPVLISNITSNSSRLGQDITVRIQFSGEETAVTWEVDGRPLPDRYRLIDNRTLLIPSAQIDDNRRRLCVRITNPVSEETREYQLEITNHGLSPGAVGGAAAAAGIVLFLGISCFTFRVKIPEERRRRISSSPQSTQYGEDGTFQNMINSQRDEEAQMEASL